MKIFSLSILILLMACKSANLKSSKEMFTTGKYQVLSLGDIEFSEEDNYQLYINTDEKYIGGKFDCNEFSANYKVDEKNTLDFGFARATKMFCEGKMDLENKFFGKLNLIKYFKNKNDILSFYSENNDLVLKLKKQQS